MKLRSFRESSIEISDIASLNDKVEKSGFAGEMQLSRLLCRLTYGTGKCNNRSLILIVT